MSENKNNNTRPAAPPQGRHGGPMGNFGRPVEKAKNFKVSLKRLVGYLKPHRINLMVVLVFAIASTALTVYTPQEMKLAMNKLQDAYMAKVMLDKMGTGQVKGVAEINKTMTDAQKTAIGQLDTKMSDAQKQAVTQIESSMSDVQNKAVGQLYTQMSSVQKTALDQIYKQLSGVQVTVQGQMYSQMASVQKTMVAQISRQMKQMQQAQAAAMAAQQKGAAAGTGGLTPPAGVQQGGAAAPQMDPATIKALQDFMKLPMIDTIKDPAQKANVTVQMLNLISKLPSTGQSSQSSQMMSPAALSAIKDFITLPRLDGITDPARKASTALKLLDMSSKMPASALGAKAGQSSQTAKMMTPATISAIKNFISLPMLDTITDPAKKMDTALQLMSLSSKMPSTGSTANNIPSADSLAAVQDFMKLPQLGSISDETQKKDALLKLIDVSSKMPDMGSLSNTSGNKGTTSSTSSGSQSVQFTPDTLNAIKSFLQLPMIDTLSTQQQKSDTMIKMMDDFSKLPDMQKAGTQSGSTTSGTQTMTLDSGTISSLKEFLQLPMLGTVSDQSQKADIIGKFMDLSGKMTKAVPSGVSTSTKTSGTQTADTAKAAAEMSKPATIQGIKDFLKLPILKNETDANLKADTTQRIVDIGKKAPAVFYFMFKDEITSGTTNVTTDLSKTTEQIGGIITAIRETNGIIDMNYVFRIVIILIIMYLVGALFNLIMGLVMSGVAQKTVRDLRREVDDKLSRLPLKYFDQHPHGDILSRVTNDIDTVAGTLQQSLTQIITSVLQILGYIIMMLTISPLLTLLVIATLPLYALATTFIAKKSQKFFAAQQKELGSLSGHVEEMYTGHKIVKAFGKEKDSIKEFGEINDRLYNAGWKAQFVSGIMFPLMNFISNLGYVLICIVGGIWITKNRLKIGDITAFIQYSRSFTMPIVQTANIANIIQSTVACAERVFEVLDEPEEIPDSMDAVTIENPKGEVSFKHVDFRYVEEVPLIENMNLDVQRGHTIAIVGPTGAGKTTLVNLLMRFYEINAGKVAIDGVDIRDIKRADLRKMFGMVLQDTWLFNGTIKDNIAYGKEGASMEEIIRAAKAAHADHFIRTLPEGYNTVLNEEATNISQGQKQLLTIARAILADPTILILDEATSSVDTRTEVLIQKAMHNLMKDRTSFVIAHRLSTIRDAELILVMNKGRIIEQGNHRELLTQNGFYADLYNSQFTGANLETA